MLKQIFLTSSYARLRYGTALVLYLLILVIGSIPGARQDIGQVASGVMLHTLAYAGLTFLIFTGGSGTPSQRAGRSVLAIAVMGAIDECVQSMFPYRHGAVSDWMVDCYAAMATAGFMWVLWNRYRSQPAD